jgi:acetolactate synthase I/II/III large subunit
VSSPPEHPTSVIAEAIESLGVPMMFGVLGEDLAELMAVVADRGRITYKPARHESAAVLMAQGYARATHGLGLCLISTGPGFTNALTGLVQCRKARVPLLVLVGGPPPGLPAPTVGVAAAKYVPQEEIAAAAGIALLHLDDVQMADEVIATARAIAIDQPVIVQVSSLLDATASKHSSQPASQRPRIPAVRAGADHEPTAGAASTAAELLRESRRPLILAGRGAHESGARDALLGLAESSGALVGTSLLAKGMFAGAPFSIGVVGGFTHGPGVQVVEQADCVLAFGAGLNQFTLGMGRLFGDATVVQFCLDARPTALAQPPRLVESADARMAAEAVTRAFEAGGPGRSEWPGTLRDAIAAYRPSVELEDRSGRGGADPDAILRAVNEVLPPVRSVVLDGGHFTGGASMFLDTPDPDHFFYGLDFAAVGVGHPTGIGVAVARPDELTVIVVGDGGLLMTLGELDVTRSLALPILVLVMNDSAYGAEVHFLNMKGRTSDVARLPSQDFAGTAAAMGLASVVARSPAEAVAAVTAPRALEAPLLVDCRVDPALRAKWLDELYGVR